jgi:hypothetical protein
MKGLLLQLFQNSLPYEGVAISQYCLAHTDYLLVLLFCCVCWHLRLDEKNGRDIGMMMFMKNYHQQLTDNNKTASIDFQKTYV